MKKLLLLLPLLIVLVAGCIGEAGIPQSASAVSIVKFQPELNEITEKDRVDLIIQLKNDGAFDAKNAEASLYLKGGFGEEEDEWTKDFSTLRAPNMQTGTGGELAEDRWKLTAPEIEAGVKTYPFKFMVDVAYDYQSSAWKKVPIIRHQRIQEIQAGGGSMPTSESGRQPAPIRMDINTYEPITYRGGANEDNTLEIKVLLEKVASGHVKSKQYVPDNVDCSDKLNCLDRVILKIPDSLDFVYPDECDFDADVSVGVVEAEYEEGAKEVPFVNLVDGTKAQLKCKVNITGLDADEDFALIRAEAYYTYHTSGSANIEVIKIVGR